MACISLHEVHAFFCVRTPWWRTCLTQIPRISLISLLVENLTEVGFVVVWLTQIPQISLISLWVGNLTEVGGVAGCMGCPITLSSLSAPSTPSAPSSPFTKAKWLFVWFVRFVVAISHELAQIFTNYFSLWFFIYLWLEQKNRVHWLVHPMILER